MIGIIEVDGHKARIEYDPEINMLRGEILGLAGGADFYATSTNELAGEFRTSLRTYMEVCSEQGIEPFKRYSGSIRLRIPPEEHEQLAIAAAGKGVSLNALAREALHHLVTEDCEGELRATG